MTRTGARQLAQDIAALLLVFRAHAIGSSDIDSSGSGSGSSSGSGRGESARGNGSVETYMRRLRDVACVLSWPEADWLRYRQAQTEPRGSSSSSSSGGAQARGRHANASALPNAKAASSSGGGGLFHEAELAALFAAQGVQSLGVAHVRALLAHLMLTRADAERASAEGNGDDEEEDDNDGSDGSNQESDHDDDDDDEDQHEANDNDDDDDQDDSSDADHEESARRDVASSAQVGGKEKRGDFERFLDEGFDDEPSSALPAAASAVKPASATEDDDVEDIIEFNDEWRVDEEPEQDDGEDGMNLR